MATPLTAILDAGPSSASSFTFNSDGSFDYTPNTGYVGTDSFTYHVNDGLADSNTATVTIDVTNNAPYTMDDGFTTLHDVTISDDGSGVLGNDWDDDGDPITAALDAGTSNGTLTYFNSDGSFEYVPNTGFVGTDSFTYHVNDGLVDSDPATVTIDVTNNAPYTMDDGFTTLHDVTISDDGSGVLGNDWDDDGDPITAALDAGTSNGTLTYFNSDGSFEYVPNTGFVGTDSFTYHVNDGLVDSNIATVTIDVTNNAPYTMDDGFTTLHDVTLSDDGSGVLGNDWDDDGDPITAALDAGPSDGTLTYFNSDGSFEYVPEAGFVGTDSFIYHVNDGLIDSDPATVTIDVYNNCALCDG